MWRVDPLTFVNLGRTHRPRCWPWSESNVLPFERLGKGNDAPLHGPGPNGAISAHTCIGQFGCSMGKTILILIKHKLHKLEWDDWRIIKYLVLCIASIYFNILLPFIFLLSHISGINIPYFSIWKMRVLRFMKMKRDDCNLPA